MTDPTIFVCKPNSIKPNAKAKLSKAAVIVIEMDDPSAFKLIKAGIEIESSALLKVALKALCSQSGDSARVQREQFARLSLELLAADTQ